MKKVICFPLSYQKYNRKSFFFAWCLVLSKILIARVKISCPSCGMETRDITHSKWEVKCEITYYTL